MATMFVGTDTQRCCYWECTSQWWCWVEPTWWCQHGQYQRSIMLVCICISSPTSTSTVRQGTFGGKRGRMKKDEAFCSFQKSVLLCAVGPSRPPTWDWGHLSAEIGASRWHFIWKYSQSCSELTRALGGDGDRQIHELDHSHQEQETKGQLGTAESGALGPDNTETLWPLENTNFQRGHVFMSLPRRMFPFPLNSIY